jgi:hypothetical protein
MWLLMRLSTELFGPLKVVKFAWFAGRKVTARRGYETMQSYNGEIRL